MRRRRLILLCLVAAGCTLAAGGCTDIAGIYQLLHPRKPPQSIGDRKVLVLPFAPMEVRQKYPDLEREVANVLTGHLQMLLPKSRFVEPAALEDWKSKQEDWRRMLTPEIGQSLEAGLVVEVNVVEFRTRENPNSMVLQGVLAWEARAVDVATGRRLWQMGYNRVREPSVARYTFLDISEETVRERVITVFVEAFTERFLDEFGH